MICFCFIIDFSLLFKARRNRRGGICIFDHRLEMHLILVLLKKKLLSSQLLLIVEQCLLLLSQLLREISCLKNNIISV